jgi:hypothetical protein
MESRLFSEVLRDAISGDPDSVEAILAKYMPLINRQSVIDGKLNEDLRQYIIMRIIMQIPKFNPNI